jgi:hypothetical protein
LTPFASAWRPGKHYVQPAAQKIYLLDYLADFRADEIIEIADDSQFPPDDRRVRIDARKWAAAKLNPRLYSDRVQQQHSGDPHNPVVTEVRYRWDEPPKDKPE